MAYYDDKLKALQAKTARFRQLSSILRELRDQRAELSARAAELEQIRLAEQADVDRLEGRSLASFFYNAVGKMGEKLSREREEAYAARLKHETALRELEAVRQDLCRYEEEYDSLYGCEEAYREALDEKAEAILDSDDPAAGEILRTEEYLDVLASQKEELQEAINAGKSALAIADRALASLGSAEDWGTFDLLGGGLLTDCAKYGHLEEAQAAAEQLQAQLRRFRTELADVAVQSAVEIEVEDFLTFADYFFDSFFADYAVMERIHQAQSQMVDTRDQIEAALSVLEGMLDENIWEAADIRSKLDLLVLETQLSDTTPETCEEDFYDAF